MWRTDFLEEFKGWLRNPGGPGEGAPGGGKDGGGAQGHKKHDFIRDVYVLYFSGTGTPDEGSWVS